MQLSKKVTVLNKNGLSLTWAGEADVTSLESLAQLSIQQNWSPGVFDDTPRKKASGGFKDRRNNEGFLYAHYFVIDIDEGMTLAEAEGLLEGEGLSCFIVLSKSHGIPKGDKPACDRFRIVFELSDPIKSEAHYKQVFFKLKALFPNADDACKDPARGFYVATKIFRFFKGSPFQTPKQESAPVIAKSQSALSSNGVKGRLSNRAKTFLIEGAPQGKRHAELIACAIELKQNNYTVDEALTKLRAAGFDWWGPVDEQKVVGLYEGFQPAHPARVEEEPKLQGEVEFFVRDFVKKRDFDCTINGGIISKETSEYVRDSEIVGSICLARDAIGLKMKTELVEMALRAWKKERSEANWQALKAQIMHVDREKGEAQLDIFVRNLLVDSQKTDYLFEKQIIKQFIWQVKQKIKYKKTSYHLMPIFVGTQGTGKSHNVELFLKPMSGCISTTRTLDVVNDEKYSERFTKFFIINFEEMGKATKTDVDMLKSIITNTEVSYREFYGQNTIVGPNIATFIGSTNQSIAEIILDTTGARRFVELVAIEGDITDERKEVLSKVDYMTLWQAVGVDDEPPFKVVEKTLRELQNKVYRHKEPIELFTEEFDYVPGEDHWINAGDIIEAYNNYNQGVNKYSRQSMSKALVKLKFPKKRTKAGWVYGFKAPFNNEGPLKVKESKDDEF